MLRNRFINLLKHNCSVLVPALQSSFGTSNVINKEKSCGQIPVAVVICGCGYLDGTEISETISAVVHLSQKNLKPIFYAPEIDICEVVDHCTKEIDSESSPRNGFVEAARLARSDIKPLCKCESCRHGGLVIPGGFGAAKLLSDFAKKGADCTVHPDLEKVIEDFSCDKKPIGAICMASVLVARVLQGVKITLGKKSPPEEWPYADAIEKAKSMGAKVELKDVRGVSRDKKNNVYSTPAWMYKCATYGDIHCGIGKLIGMMKKSIY
ncbi:glutamine amidotransferase-like class 1 domain-containing protein 3, mitochondrial [Megalopta genalis]|uniref:glutamine amidotransferase-like class 1 domain-containing protein 3, mitochondrial n=1 Tax=Megalopta genalis TaxID=115081 RepID=UPI003FCF284E